MNVLFYYLFLPLAAGSLVILGALGGQRFLRWVWVTGIGWEKTRFRSPLKGGQRPIRSGLLLIMALCVLASGFLWNRPVLGLFGLIVFPIAYRGVVTLGQLWRGRILTGSALSFFYLLQGLIAVGRSLPAALFEISRSSDTPFVREFGVQLERFDEGVSLRHLIERFRKKNDLGTMGIYFSLIGMAYGKGLSLGPLLQRFIPLLEAEYQNTERVFNLRRSCIVQAMVIFLVPWFLVGMFILMQPEVAGVLTNEVGGRILVGIALICEGVGVWVLLRISAFY